jgi:hypothetical protein
MVGSMEELEKFDRALRLVERFERYLFRRAFGIAFIVCGIIVPLTAFLVIRARSLAELLNMSAEAFLAFVPTLVLVTGIAVIIYSFTSAHVVTSRMRKDPVWKDAPHMILMSLMWLISFFLTNYVPEPFTVISWLWAGGFASLLSYLVSRIKSDSGDYPEILVVSIICLVTSLPLLFIKDTQLVEAVTFLIFGISFIAGGVYSIINALKVLSESDK